MRTVIVGFCAFWLKRTTVCFRLLRLTTLTMIQRLFLLSIHYPSRLSGSDFQTFPHCPVGFIHSITDNACHSRVTPNGRSGISAIQDMTFLSQHRTPLKPFITLSVSGSSLQFYGFTVLRLNIHANKQLFILTPDILGLPADYNILFFRSKIYQIHGC
jgi:hypothetical protein